MYMIIHDYTNTPVLWFQMDSGALESSIGGRAAQRSPQQILVDIEGPDSTFQQDVSDYFCYAQLAQQASAGWLLFVTDALLSFPPFPHPPIP